MEKESITVEERKGIEKERAELKPNNWDREEMIGSKQVIISPARDPQT